MEHKMQQDVSSDEEVNNPTDELETSQMQRHNMTSNAVQTSESPQHQEQCKRLHISKVGATVIFVLNLVLTLTITFMAIRFGHVYVSCAGASNCNCNAR